MKGQRRTETPELSCNVSTYVNAQALAASALQWSCGLVQMRQAKLAQPRMIVLSCAVSDKDAATVVALLDTPAASPQFGKAAALPREGLLHANHAFHPQRCKRRTSSSVPSWKRWWVCSRHVVSPQLTLLTSAQEWSRTSQWMPHSAVTITNQISLRRTVREALCKHHMDAE